LRQAREARGISLRQISEQTRITMRHLEAIESDDYKHLPGGIFNRSFIKAYARFIHFDEAKALDLYARTAATQGDLSDEVATSPTRSRIYTDGDTSRSPVITALLSAVIVGILILVVYAGLHYYRRTENAPAPTANAPAGGNNPAPAQANPQAPAAPATDGFQIQVKSKGKPFWLTSWQDKEKKKGRFLSAEKPEQFTPETSLSLLFDKPSAEFLEVTINGRPAKPPADASGTVEWKITKDNYQQFLQ
jgi:transcriptional regulator with XRE-family HTH domain